ncbi:MAG TPA: HEAT repeat domain-containing protein [Phycisphaerae bacterium]|nr:HEAT repeat domain-containing protein [Phycisphaerae bacterium]
MSCATRTSLALCGLLALAGGCGNPREEFSILGRLFGPSGPKLVEMVVDETDADRRREGISKLAEQDWGLRDPYLKYFALRLQYDREPSVRSIAARALGKAGNPKYLPHLILALKDRDAGVRWDAAVALQKVIGEQAIDPLRVSAIEDASMDVRIACVQALGHYHRPRVIASLVRCLDDETFDVRYQAHRMLVEMTGKDMGYDIEEWRPILESELPPRARWRRPWWDWFGVTKGSERYRRPPERPAGPSRPWWDWRRRREAQTQPAGTKRPWWDWFGVTRRRAAPPEPPTAPATGD